MSEAARTGILASISAALGRKAVDPDRVRAEASALLAESPASRPALADPSLIEQFVARLVELKVGASVKRAAGFAAVPALVSEICAAEGLAKSIALQPAPDLLDLDWSGFETRQTIAPDEAVAIGLALWGIAETGSLVFHSGPESPTLFCFMPMHHIVVIATDRIVPHLEDYAARAGSELPRNVNIVTGASGTTDIEGIMVKGAHGPGYLHVIVVDR